MRPRNYRPPPEVYYLSELHLVHPLPCVPVQESFASKHGCKLFTNSLKQLLDSSAIANKCRGHLEPARRYVANSGLDVVRDPLDEITTEIVKRRKQLILINEIINLRLTLRLILS